LFDVPIAFRLLGSRGHGRLAVGGVLNGHGIEAEGGGWFGFGFGYESESEGEGLAVCSFIWKTQLGLT
jgi:hypothetical protein